MGKICSFVEARVIQLHLFGTLDVAAPDGRDVRPLLAQPKRLALLAYLAARLAGEFVRRDTLLGVFWPDLDQQHARTVLRKTVFHLRHALGGETVIGRGEGALAPSPHGRISLGADGADGLVVVEPSTSIASMSHFFPYSGNKCDINGSTVRASLYLAPTMTQEALAGIVEEAVSPNGAAPARVPLRELEGGRRVSGVEVR